jgi:hypothetical protein
LGGCGKSILSLGLLSNQEAKFLSDNLIFYDKERVYPCYEPIRLDPEAITLLEGVEDKVKHTEVLSRRGKKETFKVKECYTVKEAIPTAFFLLKFTENTYIRSIHPRECFEKFLLFNTLTLEVNNYQFYRGTLNLLRREDPSTERNTLWNLLKNRACFEIGIKHGVSPKRILESTVLKVIENPKFPLPMIVPKDDNTLSD